MREIPVAAYFRSGACNFNTCTLFVQYACCFGFKLKMNNAATFKSITEQAAAIASIFGWLNLFVGGLGGLLNDKAKANDALGMRGRLW